MGTFVFEILDAIRKRLKSILSDVLYLANARTRHKQGVGYQVAICETGTGKGPAATARQLKCPPTMRFSHQECFTRFGKDIAGYS